MNPGTLRALEFDRIAEVVRHLAQTPLGEARLAALEPAVEIRRVETRLATTGEAVGFLAEYGGFPLRAPADLEDTLTALAIAGRALEPLRLTGLASFFESVDQCAHAIRRAPAARFPLLQEMVAGLTTFEREIADVRRTIDPAGEVFDHASPELRSLRDRLRKQRSRLRGTLESYLRGRDTAKYLQDQVITDRHGRYVLLVRAEHRASIPGIVHGSSTSGASLFLEPLSTVEINNEIVALEEQEAEEVRRILLALTDAFRARPLDATRVLDVATDLDVVQARARFSRLVGGLSPALSTDGTFELRAARHPLLIPAVDARLREVDGAEEDGSGARPARTDPPVPVDVVLTPPNSVLVITGPNTGGKTVALKTAGLLALMAQSGLHVPVAEGSTLPVFRSVFADIGDEQSIEANLSTFSSHVTNIAAMDRHMALPCLVLLDEIGSGTDPVEGGALGMAVIDHFRGRGAHVLATTHYDSLKTYASTTPGVASAAFGFAPGTFEPTFRLVYGSPGTSLALEIASKLGLAPAIVEAARQYRSRREAQLAEHLARVDGELQALEHERRLLGREREQIAADEARFRARDEGLRHREEEFKRRLDAKLADRLRDAKREIDSIVEDVKRRAAQLVSQAARAAAATHAPISTGETGSIRAAARQALDGVTGRFQADTGGAPHEAAQPAAPGNGNTGAAARARPVPGDRVTVGALGLEGVVQSVFGHDAEVNVRGKRLRASLDELRVLSGTPAPAKVSVSVQVQSRQTTTDLNVIGCSVDDAIARADKFLDEALVSEVRTLRIIHGHGTGQLRRALGAFFRAHPLVARAGPAPAEQGGNAVTVVELKD
jgi:DNA mismatch repair protein MutS2